MVLPWHHDLMPSPVEIVDYEPAWVTVFADLGATLREPLGDVAVRIAPTGSTAVPGLAQSRSSTFRSRCGHSIPSIDSGRHYRNLATSTERTTRNRTKRYFWEQPGHRRTHIHVRRLGTFSQQFPLLFRDYLRSHPAAAAEYAAVKRRFAEQFRHDRQGYVRAKDSFVWEVIRHADAWALRVGWLSGPSDA
jgi:GrpB-like predicted nucleotidyltransferase (UPF0157 family)